MDKKKELTREESKRRAKKFEDTLDIIGGTDDKKAAEAIKEIGKRSEEEERKKEERVLNELVAKSKKHNAYYKALADTAQEELTHVDWPPGYGFHSFFTDKGVGVMFQSPSGRHFTQAFTPCADIPVDHQTIHTLVTRAENTVDRLEGRQYYSDGILQP